jgi:hypothetical protein
MLHVWVPSEEPARGAVLERYDLQPSAEGRTWVRGAVEHDSKEWQALQAAIALLAEPPMHVVNVTQSVFGFPPGAQGFVLTGVTK